MILFFVNPKFEIGEGKEHNDSDIQNKNNLASTHLKELIRSIHNFTRLY